MRVFNLNRLTCYSDSKVALHWIAGIDKNWKQFVQHRVSEIRKLIPIENWRHCPGEQNPADLPSRGLSLCEIATNLLWLQGPEWMREKETTELELDVSVPEECLAEMKVTSQKRQTISLLSTSSSIGISQIIQVEKFSDLVRLLRVTALFLNCIRLLQGGSEPRDLTANELTEAENLWIKDLQGMLLSDPKFESLKKQFGLYLDDGGLYRCQGRLSNADITSSANNPILLYKKHWLASLIVKHAHEKVMHDGVKETLTEVRARFWIVQGRSFVRRIVHKCLLCKRFEGRPFQSPPPPPLPKLRVAENPPFTYTGVDLAGPLQIKASKATRDCKVWVCLYTCCVVRTVHLEILTHISTRTFLRSLKRFTSRRGIPKQFISDNGTTFKGAAKLLKSVINV